MSLAEARLTDPIGNCYTSLIRKKVLVSIGRAACVALETFWRV